jgi:hypothetical protein
LALPNTTSHLLRSSFEALVRRVARIVVHPCADIPDIMHPATIRAPDFIKVSEIAE